MLTETQVKLMIIIRIKLMIIVSTECVSPAKTEAGLKIEHYINKLFYAFTSL